MSSALNYCAYGGRLVYVGITQQEVSFPHAPIMHRRQLSILASRNALSRRFLAHHHADRGAARSTPNRGSRTARRSLS